MEITGLKDCERFINDTPIEKLPEIIGMLSMLQAKAHLKMLAGSTEPPQSVQADRYLTVPEMMERFHVSAQWLYRHKRQLPHSQPSRRVLLFPEKAIERWFAARRE